MNQQQTSGIDHQASNQEIKEINDKLVSYIDHVRREILERQNSASNSANHIFNNSNLLAMAEGAKTGDISVKNLQKDLTHLKMLYDEELRMIRFEIEEVSGLKNKLTLDNFNLQVKIQDFFEKFEEIKRVNQSLVDELTENKNKNNRLEYEIESLKIECDNPIRENRQLRKDLEDILKKVNEKQLIADNEISYRQELEMKYRELMETTNFERRLLEQEIENAKYQMKFASETIEKLELKLNQLIKNQLQTSDDKSKKIQELEDVNSQLHLENRKLKEKNDYLKAFCDDLEQIVVKIDTVKRSYNTKGSSDAGFNTNNNFDDPEINWNEKMSTVKSKINVNETSTRKEAFPLRQQQCADGEEEEKENFTTAEEVNKIVCREPERPSTIKPTGNSLVETPTKFLLSNSSTPLSNQNMKTTTSSNLPVQFQPQKHETGGQIHLNKDYTAELFDLFERKTFQKTPDTSTKKSTAEKTDLQEASYIGNIKIHEVDKNGRFVRVLNTSNTVEEDLSNFTIQQMIAAMPVAVYRFPSSVKLLPGRITTVWCNNDEIEQQPPHVFVWKEQNKWSNGPECTTVLSKPNGQAVSWTTGKHKYSNVEKDDYLGVYSGRRVKTPTCQINRQKLVAIFTPTKHPHAVSHSRLSSGEQKVTLNSVNKKVNMFGDSVKIPGPVSIDKLIRPAKSAVGIRKTPTVNVREPSRSKSTLNFRKSDNNDSDEEDFQTYQENVKYLNNNHQKQSNHHQLPQQLLIK